MPMLKDSSANIQPTFFLRQGRPATPEDFGAGAAAANYRAAGMLARTAGQLSDEAVQQDVQNVRVQAALAHQKIATAVSEGEASGADPQTIASSIDDAAQAIGAQAATPKGHQLAQAERQGASLIGQRLLIPYRAKLAAAKAQTDAQTVLDGNAALLAKDPTLTSQQLENWSNYVAGIPGLNSVQRSQVNQHGRQQLALAAINGTIDRNPILAKQQLESGAYSDLTPEQRQLGVDRANQMIRAKKSDAEYGYEQHQRAVNQTAIAEASKLIPRIESGHASAQAIASDPNLTPQWRENLLDFQERRTREGTTPKSDPQTMALLTQRVGLPAGDPNRITSQNVQSVLQPYIKSGKISLPDATRMLGEVDSFDQDKPLAVSRHAALISAHEMLFSSPLGRAQPNVAASGWYRYSLALNQGIDNDQAHGVNPLTDGVLSPKSKESMVTPQYIGHFLTSENQYVSGQAAAARKKAPPVGTIVDGRRFRGGDPSDPANWPPVDQSAASQPTPSALAGGGNG